VLKLGHVRLSTRPDWRAKLTKSKVNPWPLAPFDLVARGEVNKENYRIENQKWGRIWSELMVAELPTLRNGHIEVFGAGLSRDLGWIPAAAFSFNCTVTIRDSEPTALRKARGFLNLQHPWIHVKVRALKTEIPGCWDTGAVRDDATKAYFASQFLEHQREEINHILNHFGAFVGEPGKVVYIITALKEDNDEKKVLWDSAELLSKDEIVANLFEGLGREPIVDTIGTHKYFDHRHYSLLRITAKAG